MGLQAYIGHEATQVRLSGVLEERMGGLQQKQSDETRPLLA